MIPGTQHTTNGPLAIGGVGGSGTRVVAEIAQQLGVFMGPRLNSSWDNMDFPGLQRFLPAKIVPEQPVLTGFELDEFERTMAAAYLAQTEQRWGWGWKNPPNFLFLAAFTARFTQLRYVHVIRHGLDQALSRNTRQVRQFGHLFDVDYGTPTRLSSSVRYWVAANRSAIDVGNALLRDRFMVLKFDDLCSEPERCILELAAFLGVTPLQDDLARMAARVHTPDSIGRHRRWRNRHRFTAADRAAVASFGFD